MAADWGPEIWNHWEKTGKSEFLKIFKSYIKDADRTPLLSKTGKLTGISRALYELFVKGVRGNLRKEAVVNMLSELSNLHADLPSIILDVACIIDSETCSETATEERSKFCFIVRETEKFLSDKILKERLEIDTLQDVGTLKNKNFYTKFIKIKTKLYYKQRKFNLFREESEGYAKLIVELNQEISGKIDSKSILEIIKSLIGCFNLDPNRVLDIILESFESRPEHEDFFIPLVKSYMGDPRIICEVLGFKFASHADDSPGVPEGLYTITALLLQHSIVQLDDIYQWLKPNDSVIWKECEREMKEAQEYVRKLSIICTNKHPGDEEKELKESQQVQERSVIVDYGNQKLQLGAALLKVGCWSVFSSLAARLPDYKASSHAPATKALCRLLHATIDPLYKQYCPIAPKIKSKLVPPLSNKLAVPRAQNLEDLKDVVVPALASLGPALHTDPVLMYKIVRLCRSSRSVPGDPLRLEVLSILDSAVLPALSYMDCNCCMAEEVYSLLKLYSYQFRYCLYARWKNEAPTRHANLLRRRADAQRQIKAIMKRVSKENVKPQGRLIGKLSHAAPGFFFDYVLLQIQIYDNLIGPVVESLKYLTSLSYDMLGYCLVEALGGGKRARVQPDGSSAAPWLQCLAAFCGAACKKYAIDLTALLQFVVNQLKAQKSLDLLILKEIVQKMAGIEAAEEMTTEQLDAMAGGELLRGEAGYFCQVRNTKKSSQRLKEALVSGGEGLDSALCLLAAQQRHCCVYQDGGAEGAPRPHLKLVGRLIDQCQDTLVQFGAFLAATHTHDEYNSRLPPIEAMLQEYHIGADVAFFLARPALSWSISSRYEKLRHERSSTSNSKQQRYAEAASAAMAPIVTAVSTTLPSKVWEDISPEFYVTFWSLTMSDLYVPLDSYDREMERLKALAAAAGSESGTNAAKGRKEQERYLTLETKLKEECRKQQEYVERVMHRLKQEKDSWFPSRFVKSAKNDTITQFMQLCLFPRCIFTSIDALYCAHFLQTIHSLKTENFSTLLCYDRLFCDITYTVTCLTEGESARYGRFLCAVLGTAMRWHGEKAAFQKECANSPGFVTKFRVSNQFTEANDHVGYENYRHVCHKWHYKITKAMVVCLDSRDYVQIRNSLIVLIRILPHFPVLAKLSQIIERKIEKVREEEKNQRQDLYILATSYSGQLRARTASMMREADFHHVVPDGGAPPPTTLVALANGADKETKKDSSTKERKSNSKAEDNSTRESKRDTSQPSRSSGGGSTDRRAGAAAAAAAGAEWEERRSVAKGAAEARGGGGSGRGEEERRAVKDRTPTERTSYRDEARYLEAVSPPGAGGGGVDRAGVGEEISSLSSTNSNGSHRATHSLDSQEREMKRRKLDESSSLKGGKEGSPTERRTRSGKGSSGGAAVAARGARGTEEREARKERKLGRKRDRADEALLEQKRRREEQKGHQNGGDLEEHHIEKHHHKREKSPAYRERSPHERQETRDKQRTNDTKLRR